MPSVQFYGKNAIINAAEQRNCPAWGIFINRNLFMKYEGEDLTESLNMLDTHLDALAESGTQGVYTIKFFENDGNKKLKINEKTVCDGGSFNFKLIEPEERQSNIVGYAKNNELLTTLLAKIQSLEDRLNEKEEEEEEEEPATLGSVIREISQNPEQVFNLINYGRALLGMPLQQYNNAIGNVMPQQQQQQQQTISNEEKLRRLTTALNTLEQHDPKLLEHLEKLAAMAENETGRFKFLISML